MREIKFRQELRPALVHNNENFHYWGYIDDCFVSPVGKNDAVSDSEQCTGLKDKDGVEIYEGDIVSLWYAPQATAKGWIKFENGGFYFKTTEAKPNIELAYNCVYEHGNTFTVIGNIHENPELLEGDL